MITSSSMRISCNCSKKKKKIIGLLLLILDIEENQNNLFEHFCNKLEIQSVFFLLLPNEQPTIVAMLIVPVPSWQYLCH